MGDISFSMFVSWTALTNFPVFLSLTDNQIQKLIVFKNSWVERRSFWFFKSYFKNFDNLVMKHIVELVFQHQIIEGWEKSLFPCHYFSCFQNIFFYYMFQNFNYFNPTHT